MPHVEGHPRIAEPCSALTLTMQALRPLLQTPQLTEVCINRPQEAFLETTTGWRRTELPFADFAWNLRFAKLVAHATRQRITEESPLLSAWLPTGERVQIVIPPATPAGTVAMAIRCPSSQLWGLSELATRGIFKRTRVASDGPDEGERELTGLLKSGQFEAFLRLATRLRKNIVVSGATGTGKTTLTKALIQEIEPHERLITIEDAQELTLPNHPNHVRLLYSKDGQGLSRLTPKQLLECTLRLRPDRVLLVELRADEAFEFLRTTTAHPGSITSVHAPTAMLAFEQLKLLIKQSSAGAQLPSAHIERLLNLLIDVVVQFGPDWRIAEIFYEPERKRRAHDAYA